MSEHMYHTKEITNNGNVTRVSEVKDERNPEAEHAHTQYNAVRVVWYVAGVLLALLGLRFLLALLGANPGNAFAHFVYMISYPFVSPFFGIFRYNLQYGISRFEIYTLLAMAIYALIAWGIAKIITINRPSNEEL